LQDIIGKQASDPLVLEYIRRNHLFPASKLPYKFAYSSWETLTNPSPKELPVVELTKYKVTKILQII
jgi:hypothetical protein